MHVRSTQHAIQQISQAIPRDTFSTPGKYPPGIRYSGTSSYYISVWDFATAGLCGTGFSYHGSQTDIPYVVWTRWDSVAFFVRDPATAVLPGMESSGKDKTGLFLRDSATAVLHGIFFFTDP